MFSLLHKYFTDDVFLITQICLQTHFKDGNMAAVYKVLQILQIGDCLGSPGLANRAPDILG